MAAVETKIEKPVENAEEINEKVLNNEGGDVAQNDGAKKQKKPKPNKKTGKFYRRHFFFLGKHVVFYLKSYLFF